MLVNLLILGAGGAAFLVTFRLLAAEIFDDRIRRGGAGGPGGGGQGLLEAFRDSVDIALAVSVVVSIVVAGIVAWFVTKAMTNRIENIRVTTRAIADGHYEQRVDPTDVVELDALGMDVNALAKTLEDSEQRRARLLSDVTHELRTPLTSIDGFVEGAVDGVFTLEETYDAVTDETARIVRLVDDLSVLSKTAEHSLPLHVASVSLSELVSEAVDHQRPQFADRGVTVELVRQAEPKVQVDPGRITQVLTNLLANALGHVADGGQVDVLVAQDGERATVVVADDGEGIPAGDLDHVFERFFRGTSANRRQGSGLGLSVARGIAEAHGGSLVAASDGPGSGATFTLSLPRAG
jgi:histidine kinase